jgi:glycosyltransferase involved in cell wall biosynthesis
MNMHISIVVPFYNEERYIEECIKSLLAQDYATDRYEIIMVDNNSTDRSAEIVKRYPRVKLLSEERPGDFAARNRGVKEASGQIIAFTDSDTAPFSDWLQSIEATFKDPEVLVIIGNLQYSPNSSLLSMLTAYESERMDYVFSSPNREIYYGYTCNMVVRKALFDKLGPYPQVYRNSDTVFVQRVLDAYSCDAVRYASQVRVRRLEISNIWQYFFKHYTYGRDYNRYSKLVNARPVTMSERLRFFRRACNRIKYPLVKSVFLLFLISAGAFSYELGRLRGR